MSRYNDLEEIADRLYECYSEVGEMRSYENLNDTPDFTLIRKKLKIIEARMTLVENES